MSYILWSSSAVRDRKAYRIVEQIPPEPSEDDARGSDGELLPEKGGLANASSGDSGFEDAEETEDVPPDRAEEQKIARMSGKPKTTSVRET